MDKHELRHTIRNLKRQYSSRQLEALSLAICQRLLAHPRVIQANTILLYYSLPDEVNTHETVEQLFRMGKTILLPHVINDGNMEIIMYEGAERLQKGTYAIMEPSGTPYTNYPAIELAIIPGMGFDRHGNRLGRGKGYYDRFLASIPPIYKIGVCFDFQKVDEVPCEPTDIRMDEVL